MTASLVTGSIRGARPAVRLRALPGSLEAITSPERWRGLPVNGLYEELYLDTFIVAFK